MIEKEFSASGCDNKNCSTIDTTWKIQKKNYLLIKKQTVNEAKSTCPYYEEMDKLLGARPSTTTLPNGIMGYLPGKVVNQVYERLCVANLKLNQIHI